MSELLRINKLLSQLGIASRRKADDMIKQGLVSLNNKLLLNPGAMIDVDRDKIKVNGREIILRKKERFHYFLVNKPIGVISTVTDTHARKTVMNLVPDIPGLFPIGRLDKDTTGLILVTDDGELAHRLMHPRYEITKIYEVVIDRVLNKEKLKRIERGIDINEKTPAVARILKIQNTDNEMLLLLELHSGRKRQIRRVFEVLGADVISLKRINYAGLTIDIAQGSCRSLSKEEVVNLKRQVGIK